MILFLLMRLRSIIGQPGNSSSIYRVQLGQTSIQLGKRAGFNNVGHRLGLTTVHRVFLQAPIMTVVNVVILVYLCLPVLL